MFKRLVLTILFLFPFFMYANTFEGKIILNVNGHEHQIPDIFTNEFYKIYSAEKENMEREWVGSKFSGHKILEMKLHNKISRVEFTEYGSFEFVRMVIKINKNTARIKVKLWDIFGWKQYIKIRIGFNLLLYVDANQLVDRLGVKLQVQDAWLTVDNVHYKSNGFLSPDFLMDALIWLFNGFSMPSMNGPFKEFNGKTFTLLPVSLFNESSQNSIVGGISPEDEAAAVLASVPMSISFSYKTLTPLGLGLPKSSQPLVINVDLLPGIQGNPSIYTGYSPDPITNPSISWGGFSYNGINKYRFSRHWDPNYNNFDWEDWVDNTFQDIAAMGQNFRQVRIDAVWNEIAPPITSINPNLNHSNITSSDVEAYMNNECDWIKIDYLLNKADNIGLDASYVIVGSGHADRPLYFYDGVNNLPIAPGTQIRGVNSGDYKLVPENVYLYYLKLYTRAVVRYCKNNYGINIFQAENELNAARFAETYDWWRKGNAWASDSFQNDVAQILYQAIKDEFQNPDQVKVIQDFHIFNLAKRMFDWRDYYDIVGLNFYPNDATAYPVLGFLTGELVWSARRILNYLEATYPNQGHCDKKVWMIETAYGAKEDEGATIPDDLEDNTNFYSQERQRDYIRDALNSCAVYGAESFGWFLLTTLDENSGSVPEPFGIIDYYGLFDQNGNQKLAYSAFQDALNNNFGSGEEVTFTNKYEESENLGGDFTLRGVMNLISSDSSVRLNTVNDFTVWTNDEWLTRSSDNVKHHDWLDDDSRYTLKDVFNFSQNLGQQVAYFKYTHQVEFSVDYAGGNDIEIAERLQVRDPWFVDAKGQQPDEFFPLSETTDTTFYQVFLDMDPNEDPVWYSIKAPHIAGATTDNIYVFHHWSGTNVGITDINSEETDIIFESASGMTLTAHYVPVLGESNFTLVVPEDEYLEIPPGADYTFPEGFTIEIYGDFNTVGTPDEPIYLTGSGREADFNPLASGITPPLLPLDHLIIFKGTHLDALLSNVKISNTNSAFSFEGSNNVIKFQNAEICESNVGIIMGDFSSSQVLLDSLYLHDNHIGMYLPDKFPEVEQESVLLLNRSIFSNNDYGVLIYPCSTISSSNESAMFFSVSNCVFYNSTELPLKWAVYIATPTGTSYYGSAFSCFDNNIFYNSNIAFRNQYNTSYYLKETGNNLFHNSTCNLIFSDNLYGDPNFIDPLNNNFHVKIGSPVIDAGIQYYSYAIWNSGFNHYNIEFDYENDPDGTTPDIGVHYLPKLAGTITSDLTIGGEIRILDYLTIADGVNLYIEENSTVFVNAGKKINVYGSLYAQGTAENKVVFTRSDPNNTSPTYWYGIYGISADNLNLNFCEIYGARYGSYVKYEPATITNSRFETCDTGLKFYQSTGSLVSSSTFTDCGNGITLSQSTVNLTENVLQNNDYGIWSIRSYGNVSRNTIQDNNDDGIFITDMSGLQLTDESEGEIFPVNNIIENNNNYGIYISSNSNPNLGTYFEIPDLITGGFNQFRRESGSYDIYSLNERTIKAEVDYWQGAMNNYGVIDISPTADELISAPLLKITGLGKPLATDSLEQLLLKGDSLVVKSEYLAAVAIFRSIIDQVPDHSISITALVKLIDCYKKLNDLNSVITQLNDIYSNFQGTKVGLAALDNSVTIYSAIGDYQEALTRSESIVAIYLSDPDMAEEAAAALLEQAMIYETIALLTPGLGKGTFLAQKTVCLTRILEDYPNTDAAKYLRFIEGLPDPNLETGLIPESFILQSAYPNPFNSSVTIRFGLKEEANIDLVIYDILGRKVWEYDKNNKIVAGYHNVKWEGTNNLGEAVASGVYIINFHAKNFSDSQKIVLVK